METKNFKKIFYGVIIAAAVGAVLSVRFDCVEDFFNALQPVATLLIGAVLVFIAVDNYRKTIDHKLFVGFKIKEDFLSNEWGYIFDEKEKFNYIIILDKKIATTYITEIYAHNENNKVEVISKVYLQLKSGEIILILDLDSKPLLVAPYAIKDLARADDVELKQMARFFTPTVFYQKENQEDLNPRAYVFNESKIITKNIFNNNLENKIIIERGKEHFYVVPNVLPKNQNSEKIKMKKINTNLLVRSSLQVNKPIIFNLQHFLFFKSSSEKFSDNLNNFPSLNQEVSSVANIQNFFLCALKEGLLKVSDERNYPFSQSNFIKNFGFNLFENRGSENLYIFSFYDSGKEKYYLPVKQEGQNMLSDFHCKYSYYRKQFSEYEHFKFLINSIFARYFEMGEPTNLLIFKKEPKIIE